jgi:intracellular sulfur oxidation DsrE/DsrF family protein
MKQAFALMVMALMMIPGMPAQSPQPAKGPAHKVVFQLNAPAPSGWDQIFNNVENLRKVFGADLQVEIVFFGKGLPMLLKTNEVYAERLKSASEKGVVLAACQNTMRAMNLKAEDLFPFATPVDSGVAELVRKQEAGFSYLKGGE